MRIAIAGTHGAGKTVLAEALSAALNLPLIPEQARIVAAEMNLESCDALSADPELAATFQWRTLNCQIAEQKKHPEGFVADRCTLDALAYWEYYLTANHPDIANYRFRARLHAWRGLNLVVYIPLAESLESFIQDEFRLRDGHSAVDVLIRRELSVLRQTGRVPVCAVQGTASSERLAEVLEFVRILSGKEKRRCAR